MGEQDGLSLGFSDTGFHLGVSPGSILVTLSYFELVSPSQNQQQQSSYDNEDNNSGSNHFYLRR